MSPVMRQEKPTWSLDYGAITQAQKRLGIKEKITVRLFKPGDSNQWWWGYATEPTHTVYLNPTIPKADVSWTLWHEFGHTLQAERDFNCDYDAFTTAFADSYSDILQELDSNWEVLADTDSYGYHDWEQRYYQLPLEAESEEIAKRYSKRYPLITA